MSFGNAIKANKWIKNEHLILGIVLVLSIYSLTPRGWVPSGESWSAWAAAGRLVATGEFSVFSRNILYALYLTLFLKLPFPTSLIAEYWVTHLFTLAAVYALVRGSLSITKSLVLIIILTPTLAIVEGGGTVAAVGFFALYLRSYVTREGNTWLFLPATLLAAALCHSGYWPFLVLHLLVSGFFLFGGKSWERRVDVTCGRPSEFIPLIFLVCFSITALVLQSGRLDNNHMLMDPIFAPIPLANPINLAFFQIKTWNLVQKFYDPTAWVEKDWYFETPHFFGNAQSILEVMRSDPRLFFSLISEGVGYAAVLPLYFYTFLPIGVFHHGHIMAIPAALLMLAMGLRWVYRVYGAAALFVLVIGSSGQIVAFLLTSFYRGYVIILFPVFLLVYTGYIGKVGFEVTVSRCANAVFRNSLFALGCLLVLINAPFDHGKPRVAVECSHEGPPLILTLTQKRDQYLCHVLKGAEYQIRAVAANENFLSSVGTKSLIRAHFELSRLIDSSSRILSGSPHFFAAFTEVGLDNNRQVWSLPPYEDRTEYSNKLLNGIDIFFVGSELLTDEAALSTQLFLRYKLHILPYLIANKEKFSIAHIPTYGDVYVRSEL